MMPRCLCLQFRLVSVTAYLLVVVAIAGAQATTGDAKPETGVALTKLAPFAYPPLARQARISGDVEVRLVIRKDGSVESAEVVSGHPMLQQAVLDSVQKSQFECRGCSGSESYSVTYTFDFFKGAGCQQVTKRTRIRSAKCFYAWKCGEVRTTNWANIPRPEEITSADGHVRVLTSTVCVQTVYSR